MTELFAARGLCISYGAARVVENIDVTVPERGVVALLGANGAGKSSILKAIAGLVPCEGQLRYLGEDITSLAVRQRVRRGIVYVPEGRQVVGSLTVAENLLLGVFFLDARAQRERRDLMLELFPEIASRLKSPAWMLSGGEQQMLAIARALMGRPRMLLLDEPSFGLAPIIVQEIFKILRVINREERMAMLLVEQNARLALDLVDHVFLLETGRVVASGPPQQIASDETVRRAYLGQ
jgi:branched-chain amino acid transport system ATP-binding protein